MAIHKERIIIIVLAVLIVLAAGYICYGRYVASQQAMFNAGVQAGYTQGVVDLLNQASTCQPVPVHYGNVTADMIAVECLQAAQQQASAGQNQRSTSSQTTP